MIATFDDGVSGSPAPQVRSAVIEEATATVEKDNAADDRQQAKVGAHNLKDRDPGE